MSTTITTRQTAGTGATVTGSPLTNAEVDANFINLNTAVLPVGGIAGQVLSKVNGTDFSAQWIDNYATQVKLLVKNSTGVTINKGSVVYISGATGANALISLAKADSDTTSATTIGILESTLTTGSSGLVVTTGTISGLDTSAATEGDPVWLSGTTAGAVIYGVANKPQAPIHLVYLGTVTRSSATVGEIQVTVNNGWEMEELHDVQIISKANNDIIQYNSTSGVWKNVPPATARTNLGLAIGTNVQAWGADLDAIEALAGTSGFLKKTATNTWALDTNTYLTTAVTSVGGTGTVSGLSLSGTVTTTGNLTLSGTLAVTASNFSSQTANTFLAAPNGDAGVPTFRALVAADVPTLNQSTTGTAANVTGTVAVANGGTGATTAAGALTNLGAYAASNPSGYTANTGTVTSVTAGTGLSGGAITTSGTIALTNTAVTPGSYTYASITVDAQGRITLASNGSASSAFPSGTLMLFVQTSAPTGWTKSTTHDNKALRVVSGAASSGGSVSFTTAFASQSVNGSNSSTTPTGTVGDTTLTTAQIPSHYHNTGISGYPAAADAQTMVYGYTTIANTGRFYPTNAGTGQYMPFTSSVGGGGSHTHSLSMGSHTHTFTGTAINLAVQYVDVIVATKD